MPLEKFAFPHVDAPSFGTALAHLSCLRVGWPQTCNNTALSRWWLFAVENRHVKLASNRVEG